MNITNTYFHHFSLSRIESVTDEWGKEKEGYKPVENLQLIPCGFSQRSRSRKNAEQTESVNVIEHTEKIFCDPTIEIRAGDRITIFLKTRDLGEFTASEPFIYDTHQEIPVYKKDEA